MGIGTQRVQAKIKTEIARILQTEMNDPRMGFVTVISVDLTNDFSAAKVYVSVLADREGEIRKIMRMLEQATAYVQRKVAGRLRTRQTPALTFILDHGAEQSVKITSLLDELKNEREARLGPDDPAAKTEAATPEAETPEAETPEAETPEAETPEADADDETLSS
jgi:ribosome-binding factor A